MKVLKFGGTSVQNSKSLENVLEIIKKQEDSIIIVVSALAGVTDILINMLQLAQSRNKSYKLDISKIEKLHLELIKKCIPIQHQSSIISFLKKNLNKLESLLDAIFLLEEVTSRNNDSITSFGEILSYNIINEINEKS